MTVNEIAFGKLDDRTKDEQDALIAVFKDVKDDYVDSVIDHTMRTVRIKNLGEVSILELIGNLGIWLTQYTEPQIEKIAAGRRGWRN